MDEPAKYGMLKHVLTRSEKNALQYEHDRNRPEARTPMNKYICPEGHVTYSTSTMSTCPNDGKSVRKA